MNESEIMDIRQASAYLKLSPDTLYMYAQKRLVPSFKFGNRWRFKKSCLDEWMVSASANGMGLDWPEFVGSKPKVMQKVVVNTSRYNPDPQSTENER
jgi:excisionase family DNA binding protein